MNKLLDRLEEFIIAALMAVATIVIFISVVHRYASGYEIPVVQDWLLDMNFGWAQEFCIILFVWMAKFGAAYGVRTGIHVGVDILINKLTGSSRAALIQIGLVCGVIFTGLIGLFGALFVWENGMAYETLSLLGRDTGDFFEGPTTPDLEWPTWIVYSAVPLGSFLMCYRFLQVMVSFARTGDLPTHDHGHVEGLDEEDDENVLLEGEAFSIAEDIEHARREAEAKRPGQGK
ncbi:MAG TPA: TRAP transporter small permease [Thauera sp.]|mgnify:FL=1|jgi:C4-dicarboxylate transporter DctQ subunit|uniref:TRAP transporter small permease n=1 Tax=Thauera sp. TaxID=1905334 RepID=UPI000FA0EF0B|nr:TRAP transporter small permease [Thauera sp.]MCB1945370.1 TRAP transporter small permease [Thauera sp.]MCP5225520.1 TRAP transporter small permease [Thauera sp.]RTL29215.1 MAG: TRAP transporter small permease [Rhodocyclaceae bacterium]HRV77755.1 TRAP transporter small permease [Thauera sp.]